MDKYFPGKKSKVFDRFKDFKALVEKQIKKKIKVLRTYNSGEFCSKEFEEFYKKNGIAWKKTTPYKPQQNGIAKRDEQDVDAKALDDKIPQETWDGKKHSLTHINVIGCNSYVQPIKEKKN